MFKRKDKNSTTKTGALWFVEKKEKKKPNEQCCESVTKNVVDITLFFFL